MFKDFLKKLTPINSSENDEWREILNEYDDEFGSSEPTLFWYLSSGIDLKALVYFNEKDTSEVYKTPTVDFFIYSDYGGIQKQLEEYYKNLDDGSVTLYKDYGRIRSGIDGLLDSDPQIIKDKSGSEDYRTYISLEQMIPLSYFSDDEIKAVNEKYKSHRHSSISDEIICDNAHFYYCLIEINSRYFGEEYFPVLISPIENWVLMEEIWKKQRVLFDYVCGVCDGCRKGGAYKCVNVNYKDFLPIMKEKRFWVSDHIHRENILPHNEFIRSFRQIAELRGWGNYNSERSGSHDIHVSYLYEVL